MSFLLESDFEYPPCGDEIVGVDLGVAKFASLSNGIVYDGAKALEQNQNKLTRLQRRLAKMEKGSNRYQKQKERIAKLHKRIADVRTSHAHTVSSDLGKNYSMIVLEDLKLKNMTKSAKGTAEEPGKQVKQKSGLNRSLLNQGLFELRRQIEYKTARHGGVLRLVNPAYTSQTCSVCGNVDRENRKTQANFACVVCGHTENADINAAKNILHKGILNNTAI